MDTGVLKRILENHEIRLSCEYSSRDLAQPQREQYECRLGRVDDHWELRVQRRPPDGHRLKFGQQLTPGLLPAGSYFELSTAPRALAGLKAWSGAFDYEIEHDQQLMRAVLWPREVILSLRLPRRVMDRLRRQAAEDNPQSINAEIVDILEGRRPAL